MKLKKKRKQEQADPLSAVAELNRLMTSPTPSQVIQELSEPVVRGLLLHLVMDRRYGSDS